jgi:hypothetical protein
LEKLKNVSVGKQRRSEEEIDSVSSDRRTLDGKRKGKKEGSDCGKQKEKEESEK